MELTSEVVNSITASLIARASSALSSMDEKKSFAGSVFGNNDEITRTEGAIRDIRDLEIPPWKRSGLEMVDNPDAQNRMVDILPKTGTFEGHRTGTAVDRWKEQGQDFALAISAIDGYGKESSIEAVTAATVAQTSKDVQKATGSLLSLVPWQGWVALGAGALVLVLILGLQVKGAARAAGV